MPKRLLCIWLERLHTDSLTLFDPELAHKPLVAVETRASLEMVVGVSTQAERQGITAGSALVDARALCASLIALKADEHKVKSLHERMARLANRYGPWVAKASALPIDKLVVDVSGCAHLFGGEAAMLDDLQRQARAIGISVKAAIAEHLLAAMALAEFGRDDERIALPGEAWQALQKLPVTALGVEGTIDEKTWRSFRRLGIRRIAELGAMPTSSLRARFGADLVRELERARGRRGEVLAMRPHLPPPRLFLDLYDPARTPEEVERHVTRLITALCDRLAEQRLGAERLLVTLTEQRARRSTERRIRVGAAFANRDASRWMRLLCERQGVFDPGDGIERIQIQALTAPLDGGQSELLGDRADDSINHLIERLSARLGEDRVQRLAPRDTHLPENAWHRMPALSGQASERFTSKVDVRRPLSLFTRPQPIRVEADGTPELLRWRGAATRILRATGPERIAPPWWQGSAASNLSQRDYWRVQTERGDRLWIFQNIDEAGHWYLHGRFA